MEMSKIEDLIGELDVIMTNTINYLQNSTFPTFNNYIKIKEGSNILIKNPIKSEYHISNRISFNMITGCNCSGKSTYAKQLIHFILLGQIGSCIQSKKAVLKVFNEIIFINNINDVIYCLNRKELGQYLVVIDELSCKISLQVLLCKKLLESNSFTFYITHNNQMVNFIGKYNNFNALCCYHYNIVPGISTRVNAIEIAREHFPDTIIDLAMNYLSITDQFKNQSKIEFDNSNVILAAKIENCSNSEEAEQIKKII